jgi:hypothetical protein
MEASEFFNSIPREMQPVVKSQPVAVDSPFHVDRETIRKKQDKESEKTRWGNF